MVLPPYYHLDPLSESELVRLFLPLMPVTDSALGSRGTVRGLVMCRSCGATCTHAIDPLEDGSRIHAWWHEQTDTTT